ncbi:MAG: hypothetical protein ACQEV0_16030 [Bacillota bacterium]
MSNLDRIRKLEAEVKPLAVHITLLTPTDEEMEQYINDEKKLPSGSIEWDLKYLSNRMLHRLTEIQTQDM